MERTCMTLLASVALLFPAGTTAGQTAQKTTHLGGNPSSMIQLIAEPDATTEALFEVVHPDGSPSELWTNVPEGYVLVVTDMTVALRGGSSASGHLAGCLVSTTQGDSGGRTRRFCYGFPLPGQSFPGEQTSRHLALTSGVVFSDVPGRNIDGPLLSPHGTHPSTVIVYGYLVQDK